MNVSMVQPNIDANALLAGAQFIDAFGVTVDDASLDARRAAERMLGRSPRWAQMLLALRDAIVAPFGLTTSKAAKHGTADRIGIFPVISETPQRLIAGFDDSHLDFRVVVDVAAAGQGKRVTATTIVLTHNLLGRVYLTVIMPFHRLIVRSMLGQVAG
ncbi:MAG: hypothetical protein JWR49_1667 [Tardiphaga sp.]|jgi:hypothetical protein|nr:hypothetical protein [Tardiphaga sp.]